MISLIYWAWVSCDCDKIICRQEWGSWYIIDLDFLYWIQILSYLIFVWNILENKEESFATQGVGVNRSLTRTFNCFLLFPTVYFQFFPQIDHLLGHSTNALSTVFSVHLDFHYIFPNLNLESILPKLLCVSILFLIVCLLYVHTLLGLCTKSCFE